MLCGYTPFRSEDPGELYREISACKLTFHERYWKHVSEVAKAFIARLVVADPGERASAEEALGHAWLGLGREKEGEGVSVVGVEGGHDLSGLRDNFNPKARWRNAINGAIAMGRLKRLGSDRSDREREREERERKNSMTTALGEDVSDGERSENESAGWRTPGEPGTPGTPGESGGSGMPRHGSRASLGVGGGWQAMQRRLSSSNSGLESQVEENDNVRVHPPEHEHEHDHEGEGGGEARRRAQEREKEKEDQTESGGLQRDRDDDTEVPGPPSGQDNAAGVTEPKAAAAVDEDEEAEDGDEEMLYRVPGSFYFSEQEHDHVGGEGGGEGGHDSHHGRGHEHEHGWIGLFQRLGLHAHHRAA